MYPFCSVIIPTYSRPKQLAACLNALSQLEYPKDCFEVIIVDDGSETSPVEIVSNFAESIDVRLIRQPNSGPATARNKGAEHAKGEFLAFTDDDCLPARSWLKNLAFFHVRRPESAIGGRTENVLTENPYSTASQILIEYVYRYYNVNPDQARFMASNNLGFPTGQFRKIGGFDIRFNVASEDRELCDRWLHQGFNIMYSPEAIVGHAHELNFGSFCRQHFNYGRGAVDFHRARASRSHARVKVEPFSFYIDLLRYPFSKMSGPGAFRLSILLGVAQTANAAGFLWASLHKSNF